MGGKGLREGWEIEISDETESAHISQRRFRGGTHEGLN